MQNEVSSGYELAYRECCFVHDYSCYVMQTYSSWLVSISPSNMKGPQTEKVLFLLAYEIDELGETNSYFNASSPSALT